MDVDVVVEATSFFYRDIAKLTDAQVAEFKQRFPGDSEYSFNGFRDAVEKALTEYYGSNLITLRNKCIQITGKSGRLDADVVPCVLYRDYRKSSLPRLPEPQSTGIKIVIHASGRVAHYTGPLSLGFSVAALKMNLEQMSQPQARAMAPMFTEPSVVADGLQTCTAASRRSSV